MHLQPVFFFGYRLQIRDPFALYIKHYVFLSQYKFRLALKKAEHLIYCFREIEFENNAFPNLFLKSLFLLCVRINTARHDNLIEKHANKFEMHELFYEVV